MTDPELIALIPSSGDITPDPFPGANHTAKIRSMYDAIRALEEVPGTEGVRGRRIVWNGPALIEEDTPGSGAGSSIRVHGKRCTHLMDSIRVERSAGPLEFALEFVQVAHSHLPVAVGMELPGSVFYDQRLIMHGIRYLGIYDALFGRLYVENPVRDGHVFDANAARGGNAIGARFQMLTSRAGGSIHGLTRGTLDVDFEVVEHRGGNHNREQTTLVAFDLVALAAHPGHLREDDWGYVNDQRVRIESIDEVTGLVEFSPMLIDPLMTVGTFESCHGAGRRITGGNGSGLAIDTLDVQQHGTGDAYGGLYGGAGGELLVELTGFAEIYNTKPPTKLIGARWDVLHVEASRTNLWQAGVAGSSVSIGAVSALDLSRCGAWTTVKHYNNKTQGALNNQAWRLLRDVTIENFEGIAYRRAGTAIAQGQLPADARASPRTGGGPLTADAPEVTLDLDHDADQLFGSGDIALWCIGETTEGPDTITLNVGTSGGTMLVPIDPAIDPDAHDEAQTVTITPGTGAAADLRCVFDFPRATWRLFLGTAEVRPGTFGVPASWPFA